LERGIQDRSEISLRRVEGGTLRSEDYEGVHATNWKGKTKSEKKGKPDRRTAKVDKQRKEG